MTEKILVTGMSGLIGQAVRARLGEQADLTALNRSDVEGISTTRADISDFESIRPAFEGVSTVVHMAAKAGERFTWEELRDTNVSGTRNVLEAAAQAGCKRVVFASSGATVSGWETEEPYASLVSARYDDAPETWPMIRTDMATRPTGVYGSTKVWGEALARHYTDTTDLSVLCIRIGYVNAEDRPSAPRHYAVWCSQRDITDVVARCVDAQPQLRYAVVFGNSDNRWGYRDLTHTREILGFEPADRAEDYR